MTKAAPLYGLVLAGGESLRMGRDKSLIAYHDAPQRAVLYRHLQAVCEDVYTSCKPGHTVPAGLQPLPDAYDIRSPLNGILTALQHAPDHAWLVVAVDMPLVTAGLLQFLIGHRHSEKVATAFYDTEGQFPEPMVCLWEPHAGPLLQAFFEKGRYSPRQFLMEHYIHLVPPPDARALTNVNTEEDLKKWRH